MTIRDLCHPFVRPGSIHCSESSVVITFEKGLLDTGAQGSNFISHELFSRLPTSITKTARLIDKVVRLGDARNIAIQLELPLHVSIIDSTGHTHGHCLWYGVLHGLSHDIIIGLIDLIGPFYPLFEISVASSRHISLTHDLGSHLSALTDTVIDLLANETDTDIIQETTMGITSQHTNYIARKSSICSDPYTTINSIALQDGSTVETLCNPLYGSVFADHRIEDRYASLNTLLSAPSAGTVLSPWSKPIDAIAPEELDTPDPTSFPDDILTYLTTSADEARSVYISDLDTHVTQEIRSACPQIMDLLTSELAFDVFVPRTWTGIKMPSYHLQTKPGLPEYLKSRARPVREALYENAKSEFDRMKTYFYEKSTSPIASPLVIAPKATTPYIRLCGDYRLINAYVIIPQEPIPHVQQSLAKAAGYKIFVDLDMTNSFHQIPIDSASSDLLSVTTPWGLYRPKFLPEGVGPASGILQAIVRNIFSDFSSWIIVIFDNFLILASDYADATIKLKKVLVKCKENGLVLKIKKSWIGCNIVTFFGYEVHPGTWSLSTSRKQSITNMLFPTTQKQMQSFLGAANFFHTHIPNYAKWASELYECTTTSFNWDTTTWDKDYKNLFKIFKDAIANSATLHFPDYSLPWVVRSDSSDHAVGAVLFQEFTDDAGVLIHQPISFASHKYSGAAVNWDTYKQEAYALYFAVTQFSYYLRGKSFLLETDHRNLLWIETSLVPIIVRWRVLLQSYNFLIRHIPGKTNAVADWLSRMHPTTLSTLSTKENYPTLSEMFNSVHGSRSLHHGAKRTYLNLCNKFPGHGISLRVIEDLVLECPLCQKDRLPSQPIPHSESTQTLMQHTRTIGMDHVTISPIDEDGYIGLLLLVELDIKFPHAYPVRDYSALTVATVLFKHYCTFGKYEAIISDPGSAFTASVVQQLNQFLNIPHHISVIGRHQSNGTEHVNGLFVGHLRRLVHDERFTSRWASDTILPLINHAMATMPNSEIGGLSPIELKFGSTASKYFLLPDNLGPGHSYSEYITALNQDLATVRAITTQYQLDLRERRQQLHPQCLQNIYQPGDMILWNPKEHVNSFRSTKLAPKLLGPYVVIKQIANNISCRHLHSNTEHVLHSSRVSPFIGSDVLAKKISLLDTEEYVVESITAHRGSWKRLSSMEFLVNWCGYTPDDSTWERWKNVRDVKALHQYLINIGLQKHIPQSHQHSSCHPERS